MTRARRRLLTLVLAGMVAVNFAWFAPLASAQAPQPAGTTPPTTAPGGSTTTPPTTAPGGSTTTTTTTTGGDSAGGSDQGPLIIRVSTYLMAVGKPDITSGQYTVDFYLVMHCNRKCDPSGFEARNGKITFVDKQDESPTSRVFRVNATLAAPIELHRYPFDTHVLSIELEDRLRPVSELQYVADNAANGLDAGVQIPGWELRRSGLKADVSVHHYPVFDPPADDYSMYRFQIEIGRASLAAFMKVLFPALAIISTAFLGLFLKPDKAIQRLGIHTGALTAAILFHLNVTQGIPPLGYLVDADKFMIANYLGLVSAVLATVLMLIRFDRGVEEHAHRVWKVGLFAVPAIWVSAQSAVWLLR